MENVLRILMVEDSKTIIEQTKSLFTDYNFIFNIAGSAFGMFSSIEKYGKKADVVLMDILLDKENGLDLVAQLKDNKAYQDIPVIMISSTTTVEFVTRAKELGVNAFIKKPINKDTLLKKLEDVLAENISTYYLGE